MTLFLIETILPPEDDREATCERIRAVADASDGELIEIQASLDQGRLCAVVTHATEAAVHDELVDERFARAVFESLGGPATFDLPGYLNREETLVP